jgi:DNA-binding CsgD family transcriptional regulator
MTDYPALPWRAVNDLVLEAGAQEDAQAIYRSALEGVGRLVPHDFAQLVLLGDAERPDRFGRTYGLRMLESRGIPSPYKERYPHYFASTDMRGTVIPGRPALFAASDSNFLNVEFGEDWCRPLRARWSSGIRSFDRNGRLSALIILYRESRSLPFEERELDILEAIQPHLGNLASLASAKARNAALDRRIGELGRLSPREREIAGLLCLGMRTRAIAGRLFISEATAYRHIHNIFEKLGLRSRQELIAAALRERP